MEQGLRDRRNREGDEEWSLQEFMVVGSIKRSYLLKDLFCLCIGIPGVGQNCPVIHRETASNLQP